MGFNEQVDRAGVVSSCQDLLRFQAMFTRHFAGTPKARFGAAGEAAALAGLERYGVYRAGLIKANLRKAKVALTARSLIEHWDMADVHLLEELGCGTVVGNGRSATVTIADSADWGRWREYDDGVALARLYYRGVLPGIAKGLKAEVAFDASALDLGSPWSITWTVPGAAPGRKGPIKTRIFGRLDDSVAMARRTSMNNGALYYFCADEETKRFDMVGEAELRQHVRDLAHERADRQKAAHTAAGWDLDVKTLMDNWDGQLISIWQFDPGILTPGTWHQDCTWCPYAAAWDKLGPRALDLGYIYDYELHPTYYRRYHPEMTVQFEAIKTRGDTMCKFRISLPSKQKPGEPGFAGYTGEDV